jgi:hypothetical protein
MCVCVLCVCCVCVECVDLEMIKRTIIGDGEVLFTRVTRCRTDTVCAYIACGVRRGCGGGLSGFVGVLFT